MNYFKQGFLLALIVWAMGACKKNSLETSPLASLNVTNAVVGGKTVKLNSNLVDSATNYNYKAFGIRPGSTSIYLYPAGDSTHPYYNNMPSTINGGIYSLFLAGNLATQVDTLFVQEAIPVYSDSSCGVRCINLCVNGSPIKVNLTATPTALEFPVLSYKQLSAFKTYPALSVNGTYSFQVRDTANTVLATYSLATPRFFNCTLVWKGMKGGTGTNVPGVMRVNNY